MLEVLLGIALPPLIFGAFALLALWLGAESRPWFDERPVIDDRPNWFPIARRVPDEPVDDVDLPEPPPAAPLPVAPARAAQPRPVASTRAAINPSGV
jgi:hypothetical protein